MPDPSHARKILTFEPTITAAMPSGRQPDSAHLFDVGDLPAVGVVLALVAAVPGSRLEDYIQALSAFSAACRRVADARFAVAA